MTTLPQIIRPIIGPAPLGSSTWLLHLRSFAVAGQLVTILSAGLLTRITLPYLPLLGLVSGRRWNEHRRLRRLRVGTEMSAAALVFQIDALAQVPGVSEHSWLTNRWTSMSRAERLGWVSRRTNALATLHREAGGLGLARLGRRAADRLEQLDRLQT